MKTLNLLFAAAALLLCAAAAPAREFRDCKTCPEMVDIPGKDYAMSKYLVTFDDWDECVAAGGCNGYKPDDSGWGRGKRPVINVSWNAAQDYVAWLSKKTGKTYRLPTEAEWEYACYGGQKTRYCGADDLDAIAWHGGDRITPANSHAQTHPVGEKKPNAYGLYDMTGNVWELTNDCWAGNCDAHATRGGSWYDFPQDMRVTYRNRIGTKSWDDCIGFRLVRVAQ